MKKNTLRLVSIIGASLGSAFAGDSLISPATEIPILPESGWEFRIEPYVWLPSLNGTVGIGGRTTDIDMDISDLFDSSGGNQTYDLNMLFAMQFEARKGRWGILADTLYVDFDVSGTPPTVLHQSADVDYSEFLGDLITLYRVKETPSGFVDIYGGIRVNSISVDINAEANPAFPLVRTIDDSASETWVDPVIGLRCEWNLSKKVFVAGKADLGGFGVSSEFLWSAKATMGYRFSESFNTEIGYSYYDTDYEDDGFQYDIAMGGVFLGFSFVF